MEEIKGIAHRWALILVGIAYGIAFGSGFLICTKKNLAPLNKIKALSVISCEIDHLIQSLAEIMEKKK